MGAWEDHLPTTAMIALQFVSAATALLNRASLVRGMSPMVFTVYRQAISASVTFPICYFTRGRPSRSKSSMGLKSFLLIFVAAFIGVVLCQIFYYQGLYLTSSSIGTASANLTPAITFIIAVVLGMEQVHILKLSSIAKIAGTIFCIFGAICIASLRGPKILNIQLPSTLSSLSNFLILESSSSDTSWILGCLYLFACKTCWAVWLIMQVPITRCYPDHLSLSAWMSLIGMLQAAAIALFTEQDPGAWNLTSPLELTSCFFSGIVGSGATFFIQAWCVTRTGPFFSSVFGPLQTAIATVLACIFLHEELYVGSLLGAVAVIIGLYVVLWGKAEERKQSAKSKQDECKIFIEEGRLNGENDIEQPLLVDDPKKKNEVSQ